jgi:beta-mannanase
VNPDDKWSGNDDALAKIERFEALIGRPLAVDIHYYYWLDSFPGALEEWDLAHGRIPLITWRGTTLAAINAGRYDSLIRARAIAVKELGSSVFIRWGWEMNGDWYAHSGALNKPNGPGQFVAAWRRIHRIFAAAGATNAVWVWCPNANSVPDEPWNSWTKYYPGDAFVDWVGIDGYNWGASTSGSTWQSFADIIRPVYDDYAARKPIMIAETGSAETGGDKAAWIRSLNNALVHDFPAVKALLWFEVSKEADWRAESSPASLAAVRALADSPYFSAR